MQKQPQLSFNYNCSRGSALIGTLVMVGILAMAVGVMISSSNRAIRGSRDKILYEEAYQTALSGTHIARAWMIDPAVAKRMSGSDTLSTALSSIVSKAKSMNDKIIQDKESGSAGNLQGTQRFVDEGFSLGEKLSQGRYLIYEFDDTDIISFINDKTNKEFNDNLFQGMPEKGHRNYVNRIRITTPPTDTDSSVSLEKATFVVEARGIAEYAGTKKERVVHQQVLIYPNEPAAPLLSAGEAVITNGSIDIKGMSSANIHWAPVLAKGHIALDFLAPLAYNATTKEWTLQTATEGTGKKFNGAGIFTENSFNNFTTQVVDKWLQYAAGTNGKLMSGTSEIFAAVDSGVNDFFKEVYEGTYEVTDNLLLDNLNLAGKYALAGTNLNDPFNSNGMLTNKDGIIEGALVQGSSEVDTKIDNFFQQMSYEELKQYAKDHDGYYTYDGKDYRDATGKKVQKLDEMKDKLPTGGGNLPYDPLADNAMADRILFIDGPNQANDPLDTVPNPEYSNSAPLPDFWKGVVYAHGNVTISGTNSPNYVIRTPDQFKAYRANPEANAANNYTASKVFMDGIMICAGKASLGGNGTVYGTLAAADGLGVATGSTASIFYNAANGEGRLKNDESQSADFRLIAGHLYEVASNE